MNYADRHDRLERKMDDGFAEIKEDVRSIAATMREGFARFDQRFEAIDQRFEAVDGRFEAVDKRFEDMNKRFNSVIVLMSVFFTALAGMMAALGVFG